MNEAEVVQKAQGLSPEQRAELFSQFGHAHLVAGMIICGALETQTDSQKRDLVAKAYETAARERDAEVAMGQYMQCEWEQPELAEVGAGHAQFLRGKALEVRLNPEGLDLDSQLWDLEFWGRLVASDQKEVIEGWKRDRTPVWMRETRSDEKTFQLDLGKMHEIMKKYGYDKNLKS